VLALEVVVQAVLAADEMSDRVRVKKAGVGAIVKAIEELEGTVVVPVLLLLLLLLLPTTRRWLLLEERVK